MGFTSSPQLLSHYHQAAKTILWHNPNILIAGKPIEPKQSPFKNIINKLYFIADLYSNFNSANYPQNPAIMRGNIHLIFSMHDLILKQLNVNGPTSLIKHVHNKICIIYYVLGTIT